MDFPVYLSKVIPVDSEGFAIIESSALNPRTGLLNSTFAARGTLDTNYLAQIIDRMGEASSLVIKILISLFNIFRLKA